MFTTPFFIAVLAGPLLGEWIGWRRWVAIMVGFSGVLLVTRPGAGGIHPAAIFSLMSAVCYALYNITTRMLASYNSTQTTLFYSSLVGFLAASVPVPFFWTPPASASVIAGMVAIGAFGWIGHWLLIAAHRQAPAPVLAPFIYFQIVWMAAAGYLRIRRPAERLDARRRRGRDRVRPLPLEPRAQNARGAIDQGADRGVNEAVPQTGSVTLARKPPS